MSRKSRKREKALKQQETIDKLEQMIKQQELFDKEKEKQANIFQKEELQSFYLKNPNMGVIFDNQEFLLSNVDIKTAYVFEDFVNKNNTTEHFGSSSVVVDSGSNDELRDVTYFGLVNHLSSKPEIRNVNVKFRRNISANLSNYKSNPELSILSLLKQLEIKKRDLEKLDLKEISEVQNKVFRDDISKEIIIEEVNNLKKGTKIKDSEIVIQLDPFIFDSWSEVNDKLQLEVKIKNYKVVRNTKIRELKGRPRIIIGTNYCLKSLFKITSIEIHTSFITCNFLETTGILFPEHMKLIYSKNRHVNFPYAKTRYKII